MRRNILVSGLVLLFVVAAISLFTLNESENKYWGKQFEVLNDNANVQFLQHLGTEESIELIIVSEINADAAQALIAEKVTVFSALFEKQRAGYVGQHTEYVECPKDLKPVHQVEEKASGSLQIFTGFANSRKVVGVCLPEDVAYISVNAYLHCPEQDKIYDVDYFVSPDRADLKDQFLSNLSCL